MNTRTHIRSPKGNGDDARTLGESRARSRCVEQLRYRVRRGPTSTSSSRSWTTWGWYESTIELIDIGKELCHELRFGVPPPAVLGKLQRTGFAPAEAAIVLVSAVDTMCLDTKPAVVEWARSIGYTEPL